MNKRTRIAKLARSVRNRIEHDTNMFINSEPKLERTGRIYYKTHRAASIEWIPMQQVLGTRASVLNHAIVVRVTRFWCVSAGQYYTQEFTNLAVAQAAREGLNFHWAKWCMVRGTEASGYA